ncbi:ABC-2 type transporter [[Clostridium] sordellii]|uniref:Transport permease protein n=1 Tax=Paraclostridium sordellii TaxID=1505 RepID=A0ABM9RM77_PARSO|nr:ABC transporter permease [Paeniclostridium sordellii]EPZ58927.1 ABC-2 type transporter family protein [[Clostridium] sordellii ATCC 9714] [Paeniclostridium sordellii ATCC 9714]CEJ73129.1 ABC-type transport system, multidrug-family permease [[Clostridium] sordellii] [Paeniclostridium sordellii]CEN68682.1 ABC-2 type transporter [[Clostridium] sordellii] [Paeniclostridium sordellii]CEN71949.1 ABC-2 type transporter [[Clostridium] sordellii] [Paeniclostridium sordellii]CEP76458.1 ABC-2 type tra
MRSFITMLKTELKLSLRGLDMFIFAICMPIVVLVVMGIIYGSKPAFEGANYTFLEQSFGAITTIAICAGGVMGLPLVVSDYRSKHILKRFKVTPVNPIVILLVQVTIYALYSLVSMISLFLVSKLFFKFNVQGSILNFILGWLLVMISMFSIGIMVGGISKDSKIAGVIASVLYFPMLIFSGATIPYEVMPNIMKNIVDVFPLTQGIKILKAAILGQYVDNIIIPIVIMLIITAISSIVAIKCFKWE